MKSITPERTSTPYFGTRDLAGITIFAALWGILNSIISPIFYQMFQMPFFCDLIGFASLILATWWVSKLGVATLVGLIATIINFMFRPDAVHFLGFTAASIVFDVLASLVGYERLFKKKLQGSIGLFAISVFAAALAGLIIGIFFMAPAALQRWGGFVVWAGLHAVGGVIGGALGVSLVNALILRGITARGTGIGEKATNRESFGQKGT